MNHRPLTKKEVQDLRDKAKKYSESGGEYLSSVESNKSITCKHSNKICKYLEGGVIGGLCDHCK
tara:strand:- start:360 stop:551 length:192 start_codon:yes stop_codon:yes gene_type:complete